ncbi:prephenate dehydratase, partial [Escherichia coli]|nr:prephenate dehydratase [Escherichia coli]MDN2344966.1 prephenate dehydratase [Escherichia coli]
FCFAITNRPEQVHFKAKALPNFYPQYHIVSRK